MLYQKFFPDFVHLTIYVYLFIGLVMLICIFSHIGHKSRLVYDVLGKKQNQQGISCFHLHLKIMIVLFLGGKFIYYDDINKATSYSMASLFSSSWCRTTYSLVKYLALLTALEFSSLSLKCYTAKLQFKACQNSAH